jgi:starch phosphorylase
MKLIDRIQTAPLSPLDLPASLQGLDRLAMNLCWRRDRDARALFEKLNPELWARGATPMRILQDTVDLEAKAKEVDAKGALARLDRYLKDSQTEKYAHLADKPVAYFCAEFGLQSRVALYCGGLGILAGDHCMEASDMGLPFVGVGLFYRRGFFKQLLDRDGRQQHMDPFVDPMPNGLRRVWDGAGKPLAIEVELPGRTLQVAVWMIAAGNVPVLFLDSDLPANAPEDRVITSQLYTVGRETRLCQETILGVGGVRTLAALKIEPSVFHLNEGHSALLILERLKNGVAAGRSFDEVAKAITETSVLTIHTPVPEGNERFDAKLSKQFFDAVLGEVKIDSDRILKLGLDSKADPDIFDMTAFALRLTKEANGVSLLHGHTADHTWRKVAGRPVKGVTNGVHMPTWIGPEMRTLFESLGAKFEPVIAMPTKPGLNGRGRWAGIQNAHDEDLWAAHQAQKRRFIEYARRHLFDQHARYGDGPSQLRYYENVFNPNDLIIGFSRRFATYKRAGLIFSDERRLLQLLNDPKRPVRIVFSGKAYPVDKEGQAVLAKLYQKSQSPRYRGKVFVIEDYNMEVAEKLVQGVDVWLNNPRRPLEASGTSGMKAAANGVPNASILDGWWDEGYEGGKARNGFAIGGKTMPAELALQDKQDAEDLYRVLEQEVVPTYFKRDGAGLSSEWVQIMKNSIADSLLAFSTRRMIEDYLDLYGL